MFTVEVTIVTCEHNDCVVELSGRLERLQDFANSIFNRQQSSLTLKNCLVRCNRCCTQGRQVPDLTLQRRFSFRRSTVIWPMWNALADKCSFVTSGRYETFSGSKVDASIVVLSDFRMNCLVSEVNEKRFVVSAFDELHCIAVKNVSGIARTFDLTAIFVNRRIDVGALSLKTHPTIESWPWLLVVSHVPLADESALVTSLV